MGKKYSILLSDVDTLNLLCNDDDFLRMTGMKLSFAIQGRAHHYRVKRNVIVVEKIIEGEDPTTLGRIAVINIPKVAKIVQYLISISSICKKTVNDENLCCICLESNIEILLMCGHGYCEKDILDWENRTKSCPMCRRTLIENQMYTSLEHFKDDADINSAVQDIVSLIKPL